MTDFDAYKKVNETKAMNDRHNRSSGYSSYSARRQVRDLSRWRIEPSDAKASNRPGFNWSKRFSRR